MLVRDGFDGDSHDAGPAKTENVGGASRDIDDSALEERPPLTSTVARLLERLVTRTWVPNGSERCAQVMPPRPR
jgi:hypothetical protein